MGKSIREVYGTVLAELGDTNENIVVLDADLSGSTKSGIFGKAHPERHFNMGIAESDMVATAAGLATTGKIPFVNTFTVFLTTLGLISARAQVCYGNLNVKFGGAYCGMSDALDGATHHATEDIAVMRALPNMTVLVPSDAASTRWATKYAVDTYGPMYLRLSRDVYPDLYDENTKFECGKGAVVRDGTDVTVIACGILVHKALEAAEQMAARGVSVRVVDMYSIKPIDRELILRCAQETGAIVTAEEHNIYGGLGSADGVCRHPRHVHRDRQVHRPARQVRRGCSRCRARHRAGARAQALSFLHGSRQAERLPAFFGGRSCSDSLLPAARSWPGTIPITSLAVCWRRPWTWALPRARRAGATAACASTRRGSGRSPSRSTIWPWIRAHTASHGRSCAAWRRPFWRDWRL